MATIDFHKCNGIRIEGVELTNCTNPMKFDETKNVSIKDLRVSNNFTSNLIGRSASSPCNMISLIKSLIEFLKNPF